MILKVRDTEYRVKFGFNSFCDTDLLDRTSDMLKVLQKMEANGDKEVAAMGKIKELFSCVRDLLFVGFEKYNRVETVQEIGDILDDYHDEATEENKRGILDLFTKLTEELMTEGFLGDLSSQTAEETGKTIKMPQDHKKAKK